MDNEKNVDESWKETVAREKGSDLDCAGDAHEEPCGCGHDHGAPEVNFVNYIMSMGYQAMIFLGEVPHPASQQMEKNLPQAKFLIDTLAMLRDKTKGNLSPDEDQFLGGTLYELQMKFVEVSGKEGSSNQGSSIIH